MAIGPANRRSLEELAAAIREYAEQYEVASPRRNFLEAIAATVASGRASQRRAKHGQVEGRYSISRSPNGVLIECDNTIQIGWIEALCRTVKINFLRPHLRPYERELHLK